MSLTASRGENPREYYTNPQRMAEQAAELQSLGFNWATINLVEVFRAGFRSVDALSDQMAAIPEALAKAQLLD